MDPWQEYTLQHSLGELDGGRWAALEVGLIVGRQNGKGSIIEARQLGGMFLFGSRLSIYSAHEFKTAQEMFIRIRDLVDSSDDLRRKVRKINNSHGEEGIYLRNGARLRFLARSGGSGRGFTGDDVYLDEAFNLQEKGISAMIPALSARPNPQVWYTSSAPIRDAVSDVLRRIRRRGRRTCDHPEHKGKACPEIPRDETLCYLEWSAEAGTDTGDPRTGNLGDIDALYGANPGLGIRLSMRFIKNVEHKTMDPEDYARERLGIADDDEIVSIFDMQVWADLRMIADAMPDGKIVLAIDINPERTWGTIGLAGRINGEPFVEIVDHRPGVTWIVDRVVELAFKHRPAAVVVDEASPAGSEIAKLKKRLKSLRRTKIVATSAADMAKACAQFFDAVTVSKDEDGTIYYPTLRWRCDSPALTLAVQGARKRVLESTAFGWSRKNSDVNIAPLVVVTLALWAHEIYGNTGKPRARVTIA
jgi:hypothetical protein